MIQNNTENNELRAAVEAAKAFLTAEELCRAMDELNAARCGGRRLEGLRTAGTDKRLRWWSFAMLSEECERRGRNMRIECATLLSVKELWDNTKEILDRASQSDSIKNSKCWTRDFSASPGGIPQPVISDPKYWYSGSFKFFRADRTDIFTVAPCLVLSGFEYEKPFSSSGFTIGDLRFRFCAPGYALCCESIGSLPMDNGDEIPRRFEDSSLKRTLDSWFYNLMDGFEEANHGLYY